MGCLQYVRFGKLTEVLGSAERLKISRECGKLSERGAFFSVVTVGIPFKTAPLAVQGLFIVY